MACHWKSAPRADFAVIGQPIKHSRSPQMHTAAYADLGLNLTYIAVEVEPECFTEAVTHLSSLGIRGLNVTVPHKVAAAQWASHPDESVVRLGVANTLSLADGRATNTDAPGFIDTLTDLGLNSGRILVLGAGGTTQALLPGLVAAGWEICLWNRTASKAVDLAAGFEGSVMVVETPATQGFDVVLNTTSASLDSAQLPICWSAAKDQVAYDLAYADGLTPFLATAAHHGFKVVDGRELLVAQGARSFEWWLGVAPNRAVMREAIR